MGKNNKENIQFVISHLEGCSGNFLGYLAASEKLYESYFRVDNNPSDLVLSINGRTTWHEEIDSRLRNHKIVVGHNYDIELIKNTFPKASIIQIYPYTHIGNVLYNVSHKKLNIKLTNQVDNHFINLNIWYHRIQEQKPLQMCVDFWDLTDKNKIEKLLGTQLTPEQNSFFVKYWQSQLPYDLNFPSQSMKIIELLEFWKIKNDFNSWLLAWVIFVFEKINSLKEKDRLWSIDDAKILKSWQSLCQIENLYR